MLLFIVAADRFPVLVAAFQYISCYSLSKMVLVLLNLKLRFNTSHVTLYRPLCTQFTRLHECFNTSHVTLYPGTYQPGMERTLFQYISCYSLSERTFIFVIRTSVSIHLMLLFISESVRGISALMKFQYISCYSLSEDGQVTMELQQCFNTSHVTLYRREWQKCLGIDAVSIHLMLLFIQLAWKHIHPDLFVSIHLMLLFIKFGIILIFSLYMVSIHLMLLFITEAAETRQRRSNVSIHLMLLFIIVDCGLLMDMTGFNTSHVTLYLRTLFITFNASMFQYISCYSLSAFSATTLSDFCVSIHLMLLFIAVRGGEDFPGTVVSIHLMLLFIEMDLETYPKKKDVSIHLMLLFIPSLGRHEDLIRMFQYISCYSLSQW